MTSSSISPAPGKTQPPVKVLVVDDSAFMRYMVSSLLAQSPQIQIVGSASNGEEALAVIPQINPDVVTLDVEMPHMDGLTTLKHIMAEFPRPVIMVSGLTVEGAAVTIEALTLGALDFVAKPLQKTSIPEIMEELTGKILQASRARIWRGRTEAKAEPTAASAAASTPVAGLHDRERKSSRPRTRNNPIVLVGSSTGGPHALTELIPLLPASIPASIVVVQHMPARFTRSLAERLNSLSPLWVKEAEPGDTLDVGRVLLAPGGFHMTINDQEQVALNQNPTVHGVRPAVDVTLSSLVQRYQRSVIAVILTGMGVDGTHGSVLLHNCGGWVIAEDEASCVVWGMPRSVVEAGVADVVAPLSKIPRTIEQAVEAFTVKPSSQRAN